MKWAHLLSILCTSGAALLHILKYSFKPALLRIATTSSTLLGPTWGKIAAGGVGGVGGVWHTGATTALLIAP
jgi:hypothetical protein